MANVLFVGLHNAGRSQMSEAFFTRLAGRHHAARSAGTSPGDRVDPEVVEVMAELGFDLATRLPRGLRDEDARWADILVTVGCAEECPHLAGRRYLDWALPDPGGRPIEEVRATREEIKRRTLELLGELEQAR